LQLQSKRMMSSDLETDNEAAIKTVNLGLFERSLPMLLMQAREALMKRFRAHLRKHKFTEQQWRVIRVLAESGNGIEMLEIANRCLIHPPSLSRIVPKLMDRNLLNRFPHPADQRRVVVVLTSRGRKAFNKIMAGTSDIYHSIEEEYGQEKMAELYRLLDELIAAAAAKV